MSHFLAEDYHARVRIFAAAVLPRSDEPTIGSLTRAIEDAIGDWVARQRIMRAANKEISGCTCQTDGCDWPDCPCGSAP